MSIEKLDQNVFIQKHSFSLLGCKLGKTVTILKLDSGKTLIHSTADFSKEDIENIRDIGEPGFLLEASNFHDTNAGRGRSVFPDIPYLVPSGFPDREKLGAEEIDVFEKEEEVRIIQIGGLPKLNEYAVFHRASKTLILADLIFNLPDSVGSWTKWFLKKAAKLETFPGQSAFLQRYIEDEGAYQSSVEEIASLDFDKIIVGHGEPIERDAKAVFNEVLLPRDRRDEDD